jgi:CO dehydrogenase maturation factor
MRDLIGELRAKVGRIGLVVNRVKNGLPPEIERAIDNSSLQIITTIPEDPYIADLEIRGAPVTSLPSDSPLKIKAKEIAEICV